jgi:CRISPR-associated protein Cst1
MKDMITLYPNNVIFNVSVDGFIRCLVEMYDYGMVLNWLDDDGTLNIPADKIEELFEVDKNLAVTDVEKVDVWKLTKIYTELTKATLKDPKPNPDDILRSLFASNKTRYPNVFASKNQREGKKIVYYFQKYFDVWKGHTQKKGLNCAFCGENFFPSEIIANNSIAATHAPDVGSFPSSFPNSFWNGDPQTYLCPRCKSLFLFQHLSSFEKNRYFINTNSFKLNFILNLVISEYSRLDLSSALQKTLKNIKTIGLWTLSNIEIVQRDFKKGFIRKTFSKRLAEAIIKPSVLGYLQKLSRYGKIGTYSLESPLELITKGDYDGLLYNAYKCIRSGEKKGEELAKKYSALYTELSGGANKMSQDLNKIQCKAKGLNASIQDSVFKMRFKIIEQIRINNKDAVFGMITRIFVSHKTQLPNFIINIFNNDENFKANMYTFIGSVREKGGNKDE